MTKKVLTLFGSYVQQGNTKAAVDKFITGLEEKYQIDHHFVNVCRDVVEGCHGCFGCAAHEELYCSQNDKGFELMKELIEADIVIFAFPIYWYYMPAQLKAFLDRTVILFNWNGFVPKECIKNKLAGKQFVCIVTGGSAGVEQSIDPVKMLATMVGGKFDSFALLGGKTNTSIAHDEKKMEEALAFGRKIAAQL